MKIRTLFLAALVLVVAAASPALADKIFLLQPDGTITQLTGTGSSANVNLTGQLGGEHVGENQNEALGYMRVVGGLVRTTTVTMGAAATANGTTASFTLPSGAKTPMAQVTCTGACTATVKLYGDNDSTAGNGKPLSTITLSDTTKDVDYADQFTADYPYYYVTTENITGTDATVVVDIAVGIAGSGTGGAGGGDASAANQTTMIGHVDGLETAVASTNTKLDTAITALQLMDDVETGASVHYRTSAGSTEDEHEVKATAGRLFSITATNTNAAARYLRCSNLTAANTTPGTSTVLLGFAIPGNTAGAGVTIPFGRTGVAFSTALTCWLVTGAADTDVAEVAANEIKVVYVYK